MLKIQITQKYFCKNNCFFGLRHKHFEAKTNVFRTLKIKFHKFSIKTNVLRQKNKQFNAKANILRTFQLEISLIFHQNEWFKAKTNVLRTF